MENQNEEKEWKRKRGIDKRRAEKEQQELRMQARRRGAKEPRVAGRGKATSTKVTLARPLFPRYLRASPYILKFQVLFSVLHYLNQFFFLSFFV